MGSSRYLSTAWNLAILNWGGDLPQVVISDYQLVDVLCTCEESAKFSAQLAASPDQSALTTKPTQTRCRRLDNRCGHVGGGM